ncbi:MAG: RNA polymerase sigma factor [Flavisolibacter sp.]
MPTAATDIELWNSFVEGNQEALGILFKNYYSLLYLYGAKLCRDRTKLEDCIQDLFTELWFKKTSAPSVSVRAYLLQSLKYKLYKSFRNKKAVVNVDQEDHNYFEISHESFLIGKQSDEERTRKVVEAINQLPARQKEIIYLRIYEGLSFEEIGQIMQLNYQVVRNLLSQALKSFRKIIAAKTQ